MMSISHFEMPLTMTYKLLYNIKVIYDFITLCKSFYIWRYIPISKRCTNFFAKSFKINVLYSTLFEYCQHPPQTPQLYHELLKLACVFAEIRKFSDLIYQLCFM